MSVGAYPCGRPTLVVAQPLWSPNPCGRPTLVVALLGVVCLARISKNGIILVNLGSFSPEWNL